ncbi:MAG: hypothetical protein REI96_16765 [Flavobacterium nitrogenifigens]|uniref:DUF6630 family protein n=1 Tax=Flavobacterium nitrogenifigens TaxID=1617283 RepID=UPI002807B1CA|nr:hypothetical protein [Flavobacterium nitrogenifigens]MDQ8014109.1 hypothetical protein [Flavobacterium nitrogenifigens]
MGFFSNLFNRNNDPKSIISFDVIDSIYSHLHHESNSIEFKVKGIHDTVTVNLYSVPSSLDHEEGRAEVKRAGFNNAYEVLNELYKKLNIGGLSEEAMQDDLQYDFIHIQFYSRPSEEMKKHFTSVINNFMIFFCCTNSLEVNDFRMLYSSNHFSDYVKGLLDSEYLDFKNPQNETQEIGVKDFKKVLQAICQYFNVEIPANIELPSSENLLLDDKAAVEDFEEFVKLVSRNNIEEDDVKKYSEKLFESFNAETKTYYETTEDHFSFFDEINTWHSDWKFDPEDAEYFISEMLGEDFKFDYPEETYSHDLFPYIQSELEKSNLELLTYETYGDSYLFFVVNKDEVERILELSDRTKIEVTQL